MELGNLAQYGVAGVMLVVFITLYIRSMNKGDAREERINAQAIEREQAGAK